MSAHVNDWTYATAFDLNRGIISDENQEKLRGAHVAIAGLGGVGGIYCTTLARLGIGAFSIADFDKFEAANTNRQQGASTSTMGKEKAETMERLIKDINPHAKVRRFGVLTPESMPDFLSEATLALDGIDFFAIAPRRLLYKEARTLHLPVLGAGPVGFGSAMLNFDPNGVSFDDYFDITDELTEQQQIFQFAIGLTPLLLQRSYMPPARIDFKGHRAPSSVLGTIACANMIGCEVYKVIVGLPYEHAPVSWQYDPFVRKFSHINLWGGNKNPLQRFKRWYFKRKFGFD
jgi:molybdopterin/thiamine biosynthesis adenylyltransferase